MTIISTPSIRKRQLSNVGIEPRTRRILLVRGVFENSETRDLLQYCKEFRFLPRGLEPYSHSWPVPINSRILSSAVVLEIVMDIFFKIFLLAIFKHLDLFILLVSQIDWHVHASLTSLHLRFQFLINLTSFFTAILPTMSTVGLARNAQHDSVATLWAGPGEASNSTSSVDVCFSTCCFRERLLELYLTHISRRMSPIDLFLITRFKRYPATASLRVDWSQDSCLYRH